LQRGRFFFFWCAMADIPSTEPEIIFAGETVQWYRSLSDYPATDYTLKYYLTGPAAITLSAAAYNVTDHLVTVSAADSSSWAYGQYSWASYAEKGAGATLERYRDRTGTIIIKTATGKSFAKTMLDAIEAILESRATRKDLDTVAKGLGGSSVSRDPKLLMEHRKKFREEYLAELAEEDRMQGKDPGRTVRFRFRSS
jgi:hypothetical protein